MSTSTLNEKIAQLQNYSACDISDALLKLQKPPAGTAPRAGFLADITPFAPHTGRTSEHQGQKKVIGPASTFKFIPKLPLPPSETGVNLDAESQRALDLATENVKAHGFHPGNHWVDHCEEGTIAVLDQPLDQRCAVLGGIMAARMKYLGVKGVVVNGRVRDLAELKESTLPVWARSTSTVGTGAEAKPGARNIPVCVGGVTVTPGDIILCDPLEGVVAIPQDLLDPVLELMPKLVAMDDKVKDAVVGGLSVYDAFEKFRS